LTPTKLELSNLIYTHNHAYHSSDSESFDHEKVDFSEIEHRKNPLIFSFFTYLYR